MRAVIGAGSVGLALAARLAESGGVLVVTRRAEAAERLTRGLRAEDPATEETRRVRVEATASLGSAGGRIGTDPVYVCVRLPDTGTVADALASHAPGCLAVSVQNGLEGGDLLARRLGRVVSAVWRQTCTRVADDHVRFTGTGRVVVGARDERGRADAARVAGELRAADLDVSLSDHVERDQWLKLCLNLLSAPNALVRREDHETRAFVELKAGLLREAQQVLDAAGISAQPCDERDRTLAQEIEFQRGALERGTAARKLPLYNHVWTGLQEGRALEAQDYHDRILALGREHAIPTPLNTRVRAALERAERQKLGPESFGSAELLRT